MKSPGRARGNDESEWDSKLDGDRIIHSWTVFFSFFFSFFFHFLLFWFWGCGGRDIVCLRLGYVTSGDCSLLFFLIV